MWTEFCSYNVVGLTSKWAKGIDLHKYLKFTNVQSNQKRTNFITYLLQWMMLIIKSISNIKIRIRVMSSYLLYIIPLASSTASQPSHSCPTPYLFFFFQFTFFPHTNEDCLHYYLSFSPYLVHCQYYYFFFLLDCYWSKELSH